LPQVKVIGFWVIFERIWNCKAIIGDPNPPAMNNVFGKSRYFLVDGGEGAFCLQILF
jgi:hypothetical protein